MHMHANVPLYIIYNKKKPLTINESFRICCIFQRVFLIIACVLTNISISKMYTCTIVVCNLYMHVYACIKLID